MKRPYQISKFKIQTSIAIALAACLIWLATSQSIYADDNAANPSPTKNDKDTLQIEQFVIYPAPAPYTAFKYRLLPHGLERTPGNAAPHYFRAAMVLLNSPEYQTATAEPEPEKNSRLDDWMELPLEQLRKNEAAQAFYNSCPTGNWDLINLAARREQCEWDLPIREFNIATLIPELQKVRDLGRLLAFKARVEISRAQFPEAIETIKTGLAMARHAANAPTMINALVGARVTRFMLDELAVMIQQPKCPNMYWALTALPEPMVDLRPGLEFESDFVYMFLPELRDVRTAVRSESEWDKALFHVSDKLMKVLPGVAGHSMTDPEWLGMGAMFALTAYPKAKVQLSEAGYSPAQIKAMPSSQAILTAEVETFEHVSSHFYKWFYAEPATALKELNQTERVLDEYGKSKQEIIPLASILLPALSKAKATQVETDRQVAALRMVEAVRMYAAEHNGNLPKQLSDITAVPIPNDPTTGKPFGYELHDGSAVVTSPTPPGRPASEGLRWEIRLAGAKK